MDENAAVADEHTVLQVFQLGVCDKEGMGAS
jgi:hypothetical protein